jgi:hypothetical protein
LTGGEVRKDVPNRGHCLGKDPDGETSVFFVFFNQSVKCPDTVNLRYSLKSKGGNFRTNKKGENRRN